MLGPVHRQEFFIPHTPFLYKTWYSRRTFTLFFLSKRFVVRTSKVLYPWFLYEIPFYVRGKNKQEEGGGTNRRRDIENGNDDRDNEGDNKASPLSQTPSPTTVNATKTTMMSTA